jgi:adenosine/AMP kinase
MPVAEFIRVREHDRGLMAMLVESMMRMTTVMMIVFMIMRGFTITAAMNVRLVTPAVAMIEAAHARLTIA